MTNKKITEIKRLLNERKTIEAKKFLDELDAELENFQKFFDGIRTLIRNLGKSNMINKSEIEEVITEFEEEK